MLAAVETEVAVARVVGEEEDDVRVCFSCGETGEGQQEGGE